MTDNAVNVAFANYALTKIGAKNITSLASTTDPVAIIVNSIIDQCLKSVLEEHPWSFAIYTAPLVDLGLTLTDFGDGVSIAYQLPTDFVKPYMVNFKQALIRQEAIPGQGTCLLSDTEGLILKYVFLNQVPTTWSAKFYEAAACKLAKELCFKISEAAQYAAKQQSDYQLALMTAMSEDSKVSTPDQAFADEWFLERLAGANTWVVSPNGNIGIGTL